MFGEEIKIINNEDEDNEAKMMLMIFLLVDDSCGVEIKRLVDYHRNSIITEELDFENHWKHNKHYR